MDKEGSNIVRNLLCDFLGFLKHKVETEGLTLEEQQALLRVIEESVPVYATTEDLAGYYKKSQTAVRSILHRKMLSKPRRRVLYNFREFQRVVPDKWKK